ncbi:hypothetical protein BWR60_07560 [Inquilinus limosus]|uniref:Uncharacterized protein n=2 Tax=Inquilinus limosus TaxID=171674 RepID=A0A211ZRW5_9PROT|nr:hypothetical protein BWR60_07560 [Inquilinus limosus]
MIADDARHTMQAQAAVEHAKTVEALTPYGLETHAGHDTAGDALAMVKVFEAEGIEPEQAKSILRHNAGQPVTDAQIDTTFGRMPQEDALAAMDFLLELSEAHPSAPILSSLRRSGLLGNAGFLTQVANHARSKRR